MEQPCAATVPFTVLQDGHSTVFPGRRHFAQTEPINFHSRIIKLLNSSAAISPQSQHASAAGS
jgi:hypothetical protein